MAPPMNIGFARIARRGHGVLDFNLALQARALVEPVTGANDEAPEIRARLCRIVARVRE